MGILENFLFNLTRRLFKMDDKARERGNREIKESIENFRKDFAAIDADVSDLKSRMEKTKAAATARRADVAKASEAKAAAEKAAKAEFEAALAAKAAAEEARKAEMMAGISAGHDKEAAAIRRKPNKRTMKRSKFLVKPDPSEAEETEA